MFFFLSGHFFNLNTNLIMIRKNVILLSFIAASLAFAVSCGDDPDPVDPEIPVDPVLSILNELYPFSPRGGNAELSFDSNEPWEATTETDEESDGWYSVSPLSGESGEGLALKISVEANEEYTGRGFRIILKNESLEKTVEVTQLKKNVILLGDNLYEVTFDEQTLSVDVRSNVEYSVTVETGREWINEVRTRAEGGLKEETHTFLISGNTVESPRTGTVVFKDLDSDLSDELTVVQQAWVDPDPERTALMAIYESAGGAGWTNDENWCSDRPLSEWYGVETDEEGHVTAIRLKDNNLSGTISPKISRLSSLEHLVLSWNSLSGDPDNDDLSGLTKLQTIDLSHNQLVGELPISWNKLDNLTYIDVSSNNLEGPIPKQWNEMFEGGRSLDIIIYNNYMGGSKVPEAIQNHPEWNRLAFQIMRQHPKSGSFDIQRDYFMPELTLTSVADGSQHSMREIYGGHKYTMIFNWDPLQDESTDILASLVRRYYTLFKDDGFTVIAITPEGDDYREAAREYVASNDVPWLTVTDYRDARERRIILMPYPYPSYLIIDQYGKVVLDMFNGQYDYPERVDFSRISHYYLLGEFFYRNLGKTSYESVDYGMDKQYETLQKATKGDGVDLVFMGDAYQDIDIETGYYRKLMENLMEYFFMIEPTKSYREYFNVYIVYAVSRYAYIGDYPQTAIGTTHTSTGQVVPGREAGNYVICAPVRSSYDTSATIMVNNFNAGVTLIDPSIYPSTKTFAYVNSAFRTLPGVLLHESVGHGLGLLGDEYVRWWVIGEPEIPEFEKDYLRGRQRSGQCLNVSLTDDPASVPWSHLIGHPRFPYVGVIEGAYYYDLGVWRSEDQSVMRDHSVTPYYFNAISRQLIVKRTLELSGEGYTFEKFLAKDSDEGRPSSAAQSSAANRTAMERHQPPIYAKEE